MNLTDAQKKAVIDWINAGLKLSEIQKRLESDFKLRPTCMEVRFLVDDLKVMPKDPEPKKPDPVLEKPAAPVADAAVPASPGAVEDLPTAEPAPDPTAAGVIGGKVSLVVDQVARPGALVSGSVKFSDGVTATWFLDETGRLGLGATQKGYRPSAADVQAFQLELQKELQKFGL